MLLFSSVNADFKKKVGRFSIVSRPLTMLDYIFMIINMAFKRLGSIK